MPAWLTVTAYSVASTVVGAFAFWLLMMLLHSLLWPQALNAGLYVVGFCGGPIPFGGLAGGAAGAAWSLICLGHTSAAGWVCLIAGALVGGER